MKFSSSTVLALGAATSVVADSVTWEAWSTDPATSTTTDWPVDPASSTTTTTWDWPSDPTTTTTPTAWDPWTESTTTTTTTSTTSTAWDPTEWDPWTTSSTKSKSTTTSGWSFPVDPKVCKATTTETEWAVYTKTSTATSTATVYTTLGWSGVGVAPVVVVTSTVTVWPGDPTTTGWAAITTLTDGPATYTITGWTGQLTTCTDGSFTKTIGGDWSADPTGTATGDWPVISDGPGAWPADPSKWGPGVTSVIGTNDGADWTMSWGAPSSTSLAPAPTYTGGSNCTKPSGALPEGGQNSPDDRGKWSPGFDIGTDTLKSYPNTGHVCAYNFEITNTTLDFDGTPRMAFAINGQSPGPLIECNWGDTVQITVTNSMQDNGTAIHWHGILQKGSNSEDGVPGIAECAIAPGQTRTYTWVATEFGSTWYHSHWLTQYGDGIKGPIIIHGPATANYDYDMGSVMISDIFNKTAAQTYYAISHTGPGGSANYLLNGKNTKPDLSAGEHALWSVTPGKKHLFRFVNSAAQNMFSVHFDNHVMQVIAIDFVPIVPYTTDWLNIAIGQRYDVIITADQPVSSYFLRAVTQTGCPSECDNTGLGNANGIIQYVGAPSVLPTSTYGNKTLSDFAICLDEPTSSLVPYVAKTAGTVDAFNSQASTLPAGNVAFVATSDDGRIFRWFLNGGAINMNFTQPSLKSISEDNNSTISNALYIDGGDDNWVYFVIQNQFFAAHPIHLHGHDFSLLGQGVGIFTSADTGSLNFDNPPRRDTAMLEGNGWTVIGFETNNPGAWLMHCHIVWHVDGGLALQFIERESEIKDYVSDAFKSECSSYATYEAESPAHLKSDGESGLRRRGFYEAQMMGPGESVVRRTSKNEKRYLESYLKRGVGDGYKPRHGARH